MSFRTVRVDDEAEYQRIVEFVDKIYPNMVDRVKLYTRPRPILDEFGINTEIDKLLQPKIWFKSGGYIVINQTEALVAIDVNTGRYVGKKSAGRLEDTIVKSNLEAVKEDRIHRRMLTRGGHL